MKIDSTLKITDHGYRASMEDPGAGPECDGCVVATFDEADLKKMLDDGAFDDAYEEAKSYAFGAGMDSPSLSAEVSIVEGAVRIVYSVEEFEVAGGR